MTREEAAKILDPETTLDTYAKISYYGGFEGENVWQDAVNEACRMGAAALRALDAQEKQESFGEWISVKDRLPENDTRVLAYCKDRCIHDMKWRWADNAWYDKGSAAVYLAGFVTHWLPMPEPPKEGA